MSNEHLIAELDKLEQQMFKTILDMQLHLSVAMEELKKLAHQQDGEEAMKRFTLIRGD